MFKKFVEKKVDGILLKIWLGAILVSTLVFSLSQLGYTFQLWVMQYKDSMSLAFAIFTLTLVLSLLGLFLLFRKLAVKESVESAFELEDFIPAEKSFLTMSLPEKGFVFFRGVVDGVRYGRHSAE